MHIERFLYILSQHYVKPRIKFKLASFLQHLYLSALIDIFNKPYDLLKNTFLVRQMNTISNKLDDFVNTSYI